MPPEADAMERFGGWCNVCRGRLAGDPGGFEPPLRFEWGFSSLGICYYCAFTLIARMRRHSTLCLHNSLKKLT